MAFPSVNSRSAIVEASIANLRHFRSRQQCVCIHIPFRINTQEW